MLHYLWDRLRDLCYLAIYDDVAGQRALAATCWAVAACLETGGQIPGTTIIIPLNRLFGTWEPNVATWAPLLKMAAVWLAAGHGLPTLDPEKAPARRSELEAAPKGA